MTVYFQFQVNAATLLEMKERGESRDTIMGAFKALPKIPFPYGIYVVVYLHRVPEGKTDVAGIYK